MPEGEILNSKSFVKGGILTIRIDTREFHGRTPSGTQYYIARSNVMLPNDLRLQLSLLGKYQPSNPCHRHNPIHNIDLTESHEIIGEVYEECSDDDREQ